MPKYKISIPDANKGGIKLSGVKLDKNHFKINGSILLQIDRIGMSQYKVIESDFPTCFPVGEKYWSTTDLFCNACNRHIHTYAYAFGNLTDDYRNICFTIGEGKFAVFSKHKIDDLHWKVIIYDQADEILNKAVNAYFDNIFESDNYEFNI